MASILVVDDSPTEIHVFKTMLEKHGHEINTAQSGEEGIEKAKEIKPDLILMDVVMPGMNGFQATRKLTQDPRTSSIPVIMITKYRPATSRFSLALINTVSVFMASNWSRIEVKVLPVFIPRSMNSTVETM